MRKRIAGIALTAGCLFWGAIAAADAPLLQRVVRSRLAPLTASRCWGKTPDKDVTLPLHYHTRVRPESIVIGRDHPNGTRFLALFPHEGVPLPVEFGKEFGGFDDYGDLKPGYTVQIGEYRFARDGGEPELVVAVGDGLTDLAVNVLRYHAPRAAKDAARVTNWVREGTFTGQAKAILDGDTIELPYGSQGLYEAYRYRNGKFVKTNG